MSDPFGRDQTGDRPRDHGGPNPTLAQSLVDFIAKVGVRAMTPRPGDTVRLIVLPVKDSPDQREVAARDWPDLAARIVVMGCSLCGEDCWVDPNSYGAATPTLICMRCFHPDAARVLDEANAKRGKEERS